MRCLDMYAYAESLTRAISEITRYSSKENNNKAGRLSVLFDQLISVIGDITKYTTLFNETSGKIKIEEQKQLINKFIIEHRADVTVDINVLSQMFSETERLLRKEIVDFQDSLNKE